MQGLALMSEQPHGLVIMLAVFLADSLSYLKSRRGGKRVLAVARAHARLLTIVLLRHKQLTRRIINRGQLLCGSYEAFVSLTKVPYLYI